MSDLHIIPDGAVLIHDGIIREVGTSRRIENLVAARHARELDASGRIVMPAFVDADVALAAPPARIRSSASAPETDIRRVSRRRLETIAMATAADLARYGVLTAGAHTRWASDLQSTLKALRLHKTMQLKPLRLRSVFSPPCDGEDPRIAQSWMPSILQKRLASILEISVAPNRIDEARKMAADAATAGYNVRFRLPETVTTEMFELAYSAGAIALLSSVSAEHPYVRALSDSGCLDVVLSSQTLAGDFTPRRKAIDEGVPVALASGRFGDATSSLNPQFLIYMACQKLGMSVEEAILSVTYNAACSLRLSHVTGSLTPAKSADICIVDVDDYRDLPRRAGHHDISLVLRAGRTIFRRSGLIQED
jgi:imidazolonepropionase